MTTNLFLNAPAPIKTNYKLNPYNILYNEFISLFSYNLCSVFMSE